MILGLLSDTHGRVERCERAVATLLARGASHLVHLGDLGEESILHELLAAPATVVFGNVDDEEALGRAARAHRLDVAHPGEERVFAGRRVAITHGHDRRRLEDLLAAGPDYLLHGHTHRLRDERIGPTRIVNPGALHRARPHTAALLDLATDRLEVIAIA